MLENDAWEKVINMPNKLRKEDLRILKTKKALTDALSKLLELRSFSQITVNDLSFEALISRTTFYSHFNDKYDLLKFWFTSIKPQIINNDSSYKGIEKSVNDFVYTNRKVIKNLIENPNRETSKLLCEFLFSLLNSNGEDSDNGKMSREYTVLSEFSAGGMLNYISWQVENKFPADLPLMNPFYYDILTALIRLNKVDN